SWALEQQLLADDASPNSDFGYSVSLNEAGDRALVGARMDDHDALNAGAAYVFTRNGTVWMQETRLTSPSPHANDRFGTSVALAGPRGMETAVIGSPRDDQRGIDAGAAWVFHRNGRNWNLESSLHATDAATGKLFGG